MNAPPPPNYRFSSAPGLTQKNNSFVFCVRAVSAVRDVISKCPKESQSIPPRQYKNVVVFRNEELHLFQQKSKIIKSGNFNFLKMLVLVVIELGCKSGERKLHS